MDEEKLAIQIGRVSSPLPSPKADEVIAGVDPYGVSRQLRDLAEGCNIFLALIASEGPSGYFQRNSELMEQARQLEPRLQSLRFGFASALAANGDSGGIRLGDREGSSSGHLALFEWCREVLFTTWAAADPAKVLEVGIGMGLAFTEKDFADNWNEILEVCDEIAPVDPGGINPQLDAEQGMIAEDPATVPCSLNDTETSIVEGYRLADQASVAHNTDQIGAPDAHDAHGKKLFPKGLPDDQDLIDAVLKLDTERADGISDIDILREFLGEAKGSDPEASAMQGKIRALRQRGGTTLPAR